MYSQDKYPSPTGMYLFQIAAWEVRMSHWIESFTLVEASTGAVVLRFGDTNWSLDTAEWLSDSVVKIEVRKYPGNHTPSSCEVRVDCETRMAEVAGRPGPPIPLREVESALRDLLSSGTGKTAGHAAPR